MVLTRGPQTGGLAKAESIENYYGFAEPISGAELARRGVEGAKRLGVTFIEQEVLALSFPDTLSGFLAETADQTWEADSVILAAGASRQSLNVPGIREYEGRGVSYCAVCDAFFYRGKTAAVIGAGEYALHEAQVLLPHAAKVMMLTNGAEPAVRIPETIEVHREPVSAVEGEQRVRSVRLDDGTALAADGVFLALGTAGSTDLARKIGALTDGSSIRVDEHMATNVPGLFAAGDCTGGLLQIAKAVWQGAEAGLSAIRYLRQKQA